MYPDLCKRLIEIILNIRVRKIEYAEREKVIESRIDSKGVRLDVYVEDDLNRSFDLEMQVADSDNISKRMRYYQGLIDGDKLKHGDHYSILGESYIIFICPFDKFGKGRHVYTFRERCDEERSLTLDDGAVKIFLNTKGKVDDVSPEIKKFLEYVEAGIISGQFVTELDEAVKSVKFNERARLEYMTFEMYMKEREMEIAKRSREEGREEGREEERESIAITMLNVGEPLEKIRKFTKLSLKRIKALAGMKNDE